MATIAEKIANRFEHGQKFTDDSGNWLPTFCSRMCLKEGGYEIRDNKEDGTSRDRYVFADGSVIVVLDEIWDLGFESCWCCQGNGHDPDCPEGALSYYVQAGTDREVLDANDWDEAVRKARESSEQVGEEVLVSVQVRSGRELNRETVTWEG